MKRRGSGILIHITSLPSPHGIGDLGPEAFDLGLDEKAWMNRPGTITGNREWRLFPGALTPAVAGKLKGMTELYGRD